MSQSATPTDEDSSTENANGQDWFRLSAEKVASHLGVTLSEGLSRSEAQKRLRRVGPNQLRETRTVPWYDVLADQFKNVIMALLAGAAVISFVIGDMLEGLAIVVVMILNGGIGFLTEYRANRAMEALQKLGTQAAVLLRDGHKQTRPAADIVPGDVIKIGRAHV